MVNSLMQNTILLNNVNVNLFNQQILSNINLEISSKHSLCLVGKGSSGKSTLLKTIIGLIKISSGDIFINNISISEKKKFNKILNSFGMVFEKDALFDSLSVWENIMFKSLGKFPQAKLIKRSENILIKVGLAKKDAFLYPSELSGGMRKRVAIARAISHNPKFLLLDEPTAGLDPIKTNMIFSIIKKLSVDLNITVLAVSSDVKGAINFFDRMAVINKSKIHWCGLAGMFRKKPTKLIEDLLKGF